MSKSALNVFLAVRDGEKTRSKNVLESAYHQLQKQEPMKGLARVYNPKDDDGDVFPPESTKVQVKVEESVGEVREQLEKLFDITACVEYGNCEAKADLIVGDTPLLKDVPVSYLLFLEHQLVDIRTFISKLPVLDPSEDWHYDKNNACYATKPVQTVKTKKCHKVIEKSPATKEHPAQVELIYEDLPIGTWSTTKFSGCAEAERVKILSKRVDDLQKAVKIAREKANATPVAKQEVGRTFFDFLFAE